MKTMSKIHTGLINLGIILPGLLFAFTCAVSAQTTSPTNIDVSNAVQQASVHRLGVNLGDETYFDSGQIMKNLIFNNPGFEGLRYRMIYKCSKVTSNTCQDDNQYAAMATNYWVDGTYRVLSGTQAGTEGTIAASLASSNCSGCGQTIQFDKNIALASGDYIAVTQYIAGGGDAGWGESTAGGATITTELNDLSPNTPGKQAMLLSAAGTGQSAVMTQGFDTWSNLSFIQLNGNFEVTFRAKGMGGNNKINVSARRLQAGQSAWLSQTLTLTNSWQDYSLTFTANETGSGVGPVQLNFTVTGSNAELDDVSMNQINSDPSNTTVFRDDVVNTLKELNPGTLRMMAAGAALASDIPNQLQTPYARYRMGFNSSGKMPNISFGIHEFLQLCQTVGADPWITIPTATTPAEMEFFIQYLTGTGSDQWSTLRVSRGQDEPWTTVFKKIHIELGNETWNGSFKGESMNYPGYPQWANTVFGAARATTGFKAANFDLVIDGWASSSGYTATMLSTSNQHDSVDMAPYLLYSANDESQALQFGALFAEPEEWTLPGGEVANIMKTAAAAPSATASATAVSVYETNLGTMIGNITKPELDALAPSIGAGLAHTVHMLEMMRLGVQYQNAFSLTQYEYKRGDQSLVRLWGLVVDMGATNRRRPQFLTQALANSAINGNMVATAQTGANPTWNQPMSSDGVKLNGAHLLQSFAFQNAQDLSVVVFNLSQTTPLPVTFSGANAPTGSIQVSQITSANITDSNEFADNVQTVTSSLSGVNATTVVSLPPFSMTVLTWNNTTTQAPGFSVAAGTYTTAQIVSLSDLTAGAVIHYTTDGSAATASSAIYSSPIAVNTSVTVNAMAVAPNLAASPDVSSAYIIQLRSVTAPLFSVPGGAYTGPQSVAISTPTASASIFYTVDGSTPTVSSNAYKGPIAVNSSSTLRAFAIASGASNSSVSSATYAITPPTATAAPVFSVSSGTYTKQQSVTVSDKTSGAVIYYTINGSAPTASSTVYSAAITVSTTSTLKAIAIVKGGSSSPVTSATYTMTSGSGDPVPQSGFAPGEMVLNGSAKLSGNTLMLTSGGYAQISSAWLAKKVSVGSFTTDFDFQVPSSGGDGFTFTLQNAPKGLNASGGNGQALGYAGITKSVAFKFVLYDDTVHTPASQTGVMINGTITPTVTLDMSGSGISLHNGHVLHAHIRYVGNNLTETVTDATTGASFTHTYSGNITSVLGTSTAYVGFTASTGGFTAVQNILSWTFTCGN
jgi:alpha-L-arabinofuranosidase